MSQVQQSGSAFNLIVEGVGYLNRIRLVKPKKGPTYVACTINAMHGQSDSVEYVSIDCIVVGAIAIQVIEILEDSVKAEKKVIIGFRAGDPKPDFYEFEDRKTNEIVRREGLKARLLQITHAKVDGQRVTIPVVERPAPVAQQADSRVEAGSACDDASVNPA